MLKPPESTIVLLVFAILLLPALASAEPATEPSRTPEVEIEPKSLRTLALRLGEAHPGGSDQSVSHVSLPESSDGIGPGSRIHISRPDGSFVCTAAFVFHDGSDYLLGSAGHCFLPSGAVSTHGPRADYDPAQTSVRVCIAMCNTGGLLSGFSGSLVSLGDLVYARQTGQGGAIGNDFGLVKIPPSLEGEIRAGLPTWGGPTTSDGENVGPFDVLCHHGNSAVFGETALTKSRIAKAISSGPRSFTGNGLIASGDSGSAIVTCGPSEDGWHGVAPVGIITHGNISLLITFGFTFHGTSYSRALELASEDAGITLNLVTA